MGKRRGRPPKIRAVPDPEPVIVTGQIGELQPQPVIPDPEKYEPAPEPTVASVAPSAEDICRLMSVARIIEIERRGDDWYVRPVNGPAEYVRLKK